MRIMMDLTLLLRKANMFKTKQSKRISRLENEIDDLKKQIDYLYDLIHEESSSALDDDYDGEVTEIPPDIYDEIKKHCENKNFIFMGVA